jgi:hypothetical protein
MKALVLGILTGLFSLSASAQQATVVRCETSSRGLIAIATSRDYATAQQLAIQRCEQRWGSNYYECEYNLYCYYY